MVTSTMGSEKPVTPLRQGLVKFVNSADNITLITNPKERTEVSFIFSNITAPKLAKRPKPPATTTNDEPFAWEAKEYLRQKIIGKIVYYKIDKVDDKNDTRVYGTIYYPDKDTSITEQLIAEGLVSLRAKDANLIELENKAKENKKGKYTESTDIGLHVRNVVWEPEPKVIMEKFGKKMVKAQVDNINSTMVMRAFIIPDHYYVAFTLSGIKVVKETEEYGKEVKQFLEERVLQRDVKIIIEGIQNENYKIMNATLIHEGQNVNIGELLVKEGFASCNTVLSGVYDDKKLREAENKAKSEKKRRWKNHVPKKPPKERQAYVLEIVNGDALVIKHTDDKEEKIFLSSIRPPRAEKSDGRKPPKKPLYDIPWLYEAREFLRTRLIGKKVTISEDYIQPGNETFPEKKCCSVFVGGENIAEALLSKGLAYCVKHRDDDENKSPYYEKLRQAEEKAEKDLVGVWAKKDIPVHRVNDTTADQVRAKAMFPSLQRTSSIEGIVEFVASGSRFRIYIDRETCLITFLLAGIDCPRASRPVPKADGSRTMERTPSEEFGEEALDHVKKMVLQRTVEIKVETMDKRGGMIGWMFCNGVNISLDLVEQGFAAVHVTADKSIYGRALKAAEERAKNLKLRRWANYSEEDENKQKEKDDDTEVKSDRAINYIEAVVSVVTDDLTIYAQKSNEESKIDSLMSRLRQEFKANSPVIGAYTPRRNDICAARFSADQEWYRAKVEKLAGRKANIFYIDYGNREQVEFNDLTFLPENFKSEPGYAHEYKLALTKCPPEDYKPDSIQKLQEELDNRKVLLNVEYSIGAVNYVTVFDPVTKNDIIKSLIANGYFLVETRRDRRLQSLVSEYTSAQDDALKKRYNIWEYGDIREDDERGF